MKNAIDPKLLIAVWVISHSYVVDDSNDFRAGDPQFLCNLSDPQIVEVKFIDPSDSNGRCSRSTFQHDLHWGAFSFREPDRERWPHAVSDHVDDSGSREYFRPTLPEEFSIHAV